MHLESVAKQRLRQDTLRDGSRNGRILRKQIEVQLMITWTRLHKR